ncbi:MAG: DUF2520 domain-containing protein [Chitinophagaceae bacterium]|nr:DUF2520 domain-containing protein [Chitinophagaceae bacterium]
MRVTLIGSGNVATVLGRKIFHAGHIIHQVSGRNSDAAKRLADELSAEAVSQPDAGADIYIVTVSDDALQNISTWLQPIDKLIVHTAGSVSIGVLKDISSNYGVIWPIQSIRKETSTAPVLPVVIDANNQWNKMKLQGFAQSFAESVTSAGDEERRKLHLAAVTSGNFSNYLFTLVEEFCNKERVNFKLMLPLLRETVNRMEFDSPSVLQTGPAVRNDLTTIEKHKILLKGHASLLNVYVVLSEKIIEYYSGRR